MGSIQADSLTVTLRIKVDGEIDSEEIELNIEIES